MYLAKLPYWEELVTIDLYLDQVLLYVNEVTISADIPLQKPLTASMVNNYVKHGYVTKPIKKKYGRQQLAQLITILLLKEVFAIQEVAHAIHQLKKQYNPDQLYNAFIAGLKVDCSNHQIAPEVVKSACDTLLQYHATLSLMKRLEEDIHD